MKVLVSCCYVRAISVIALEQKGQAWLSKATSQNKTVISTATEVLAGGRTSERKDSTKYCITF
jgi:hypothetical protein